MGQAITILGSTGSIGQTTTRYLSEQAQRHDVEAFDVKALVGHKNVSLLAQQAKELKAQSAITTDSASFAALKEALSGTGIDVRVGRKEAIAAAALGNQTVLSAMVGIAGLEPTMEAVKAGNRVALANKEALVCAGDFMTKLAKQSGAQLLPVDSEHSAIFQCLQGCDTKALDSITLTASGGPFRESSIEQMKKVTPADAVAHPNWSMGAKISVDSATMMNKGLELIEAAFLFDLPSEKIGITIHPQSIVHSFVHFHDGSTLAQLGEPDMMMPISYALTFPDRCVNSVARLNPTRMGQLDFSEPDDDRFPLLPLAAKSLEAKNGATVVLNAANEIAVAAFLQNQLSFLGIADLVARMVDAHDGTTPSNIDEIIALDAITRQKSNKLIA